MSDDRLKDWMPGALREARVQNDGVLDVPLWYPGSPGEVHTIEVGLVHVRAADAIRITYDFERDGYSIKQRATSKEGHETYDIVETEEWREAAFLEAWALSGALDEEAKR